jgi:hypothetical protein
MHTVVIQVPSALQTVEVKFDCTCPNTVCIFWLSDTNEITIEMEAKVTRIWR